MKSFALLVLVAACGGGTSAGPADAAPPVGDPVTVHYQVSAMPPNDVVAGATVLFYDADGNLVERAVTDATGVAHGHVLAGGAVTATDAHDYVTWFDVEPGDTLWTTWPIPQVSQSSMLITLPRDGDASFYDATGPGFFGQLASAPPATGPISFSGTLDLSTATTGTVVAEATHPSAPTRFLVVPGVSLPQATLDLSASTWIDPTPLDVQLTDLPSPFTTAGWRYTEYRGETELWNGTQVTSNPTGSVTLHYATPGALGDGAAITAYPQLGDPRRFFALAIGVSGSTIDVGAMIPPRLDALALGADDTLTWTRDGAGPPSLAIVIDLRGQSGASWTVIAPGASTSLRLPPLPADLAPVGLAATGGRFVGGNDPRGYRGYVIDPAASSPYVWADERPAAGTYRISE